MPILFYIEFDIVMHDNNSFWACFNQRWNCQFVWFSQRCVAFHIVMELILCFAQKMTDLLCWFRPIQYIPMWFPSFYSFFHKQTHVCDLLCFNNDRKLSKAWGIRTRGPGTHPNTHAQMHVHTNTQQSTGSTWPVIVLFPCLCNDCSVEHSSAISSSFYTSYN